MSHLIATVTQIDNFDSLNIVNFRCNSQNLSMMSLDLSDDVKVGAKVELVVKPSHVAIAKNFNGEVSYSNQLPTIIKSIDNGELLSSVKLDFFDTVLESIITFSSSKRMDLKVGDEVTAFIKSSELSILKVMS